MKNSAVNPVPTMKTWFDRRCCIICSHPPTSLSHPNIPDTTIPELFEESSPSIPATTPPTNSNNNNSNNNNKNKHAITINFNNKPLTLSLPSLSNIEIGIGATIKCKQCFARVHLNCLKEINNKNKSKTDINNIICPMCTGNINNKIQSNYNNLFESIEEEKNLLRDLLPTECLVCGDVGNLICCDLCYHDTNDNNNTNNNNINNKLFITSINKLDISAQFHINCLIDTNRTLDPFICPLCTRQYGSNRLQSLHFFQRKRLRERETRMQSKALLAQEFCKTIGFRVDEIKKCVFCRINSDDTANGVFFDKENEFIGPFYDDKHIKYYAHYQCVMWSPQVYMNEQNEFCNVEREIKRSKGLTCSVCGKHGAVLGCYERGCYNTYHYLCALNEEHCYFDNELFAIYCPSHYYIHFLDELIDNNKNIIFHENINGINKNIFEKCRFDNQSIIRKRKTNKSSANDIMNRYKYSVDVWKFILKQKHKHNGSTSNSTSVSLSRESSMAPSVNNNNNNYLTRHKRKQIELYNNKQIEKKKKRYKKSLMSIGGRKRYRNNNYLNGNLCTNVHGNNEQQLSPHEAKRRKVFNLQPMTLNDSSNINNNNDSIQIEPDKINFNEFMNDMSKYNMESMVGGQTQAIKILKETVLLPLLYPELFQIFKLKPAKGIILYGPPGTGKTLLVRSLIKYYYSMSKAIFSHTKSNSNSPLKNTKSLSIGSSISPKQNKNPNQRYNTLADAVLIDNNNRNEKELHSNESLISFFSRRGPDLLSKFHGETERNLRSLFKRAQELSPSIIFFDEIDGMCPIRSMKHEQVNNSVVATLLSLMDGLDNKKNENNNKKVFVIAATNRIDNLDPALRRPGRFDREIYIGLPNKLQRYKILKIHTKEWNLNENKYEFNKYLKNISNNKTIGFSGADLKALCNETFMNCIYRICPQLKSNGECGYNVEIANKLKNENIIISIHDFEETFKNGFKSSNVRSSNIINIFNENDQNIIDNLNKNMKNILNKLIQRVDIYINKNKNGLMEEIEQNESDSDNSDNDIDINNNNNYMYSIKQSHLIHSLYSDRILICGNNNLNKLFLKYLLHKLDIANIQYITIPIISSLNNNKQEIYTNILSKIKLSINTNIGVIIIYDLDIWLQYYPNIIQNILLSNINDMCKNRNTLILATSNIEWNATNCWKYQWPQNIYKYFSHYNNNFIIK